MNEASVVMVPLPWASSNTEPSPAAPPPCVIPYRLPLLSMTSPGRGATRPPGPLNGASVVIVLLPLPSSNTVPNPEIVVPYKLPLPSMIRLAYGAAPLPPLNVASVVIVLLPWASSNTVPAL